MDERIQALSSRGATVVWLTVPAFSPPAPLPMSTEEIEAARSRYNEFVRDLPARHPGRVEVVDLAVHVARWPEGPFDLGLREDGLHFTKEGGRRMLDAGLGAELSDHVRSAMLRRQAEQANEGPGSGS